VPAVALIHDWWGITPIIRRMAHLFAQSGYYVIVPDLFGGRVATTPQEALELVKALGDDGFPRIDAALGVLEHHHHTNSSVAAIGVGMGGSLAFEAALVRRDLEAAIVYYGFPQRYLGRFREAKTPILAFYGTDEPYIQTPVINRLRSELASNPRGVKHEIAMLQGVGHDFFCEDPTEAERQQVRLALNRTFAFLDHHLQGPSSPAQRQ
jgi:carboxymethylenebutenolidase